MAQHPYPKRSSRTHAKEHKQVCALFEVKAHRFPPLPKASELGISYTQRAALRVIRRMEADLIEELCVWDIAVAERKLAAIEAMISEHFPEASNPYGAAPLVAPSVATEQRALAS